MNTRILRKPTPAGFRSTIGGQRGFSSVEILMAMAVTLIIMGGFVAVNKFQLGTLREEARQMRSRGVGRSVTDLVSREIRRAESIDLLADVHGLRIRSDLNRNGTTDATEDSPEEDVLYGLYENALWRKTGGAGSSSGWERLSGEHEMAGVEWYFESPSGAEIDFAAAQALPAQTFARIQRAGLRLNIQSAQTGNEAGRHLRMAADSTMRKRFFVHAIGHSVNDAIYQPFDVAAFVAGIDPLAPTLVPNQPTATPSAPLSTPVAPTPIPATATPSDEPVVACAARNFSCTQNADCCSNHCRGNGSCN